MKPIELAVHSVQARRAHCRLTGTDWFATYRSDRTCSLVPGEVAVVRPDREWTYGGKLNVSGEIKSTRIDAAALALKPLEVEDRGLWKPIEHYWGEEGEPIERWAKPIIARGPRPQFEMEQVLPGEDADDPFSDPIIEAVDRKAAGDSVGAHKILMKLCEADLRCLDAHSHLGHFAFDRRPEVAIRHYEVGVRIAELSLGKKFEGLLPWGLIDNRPFLRCISGFGLCLWRLGRFAEALDIFKRMLWLNPGDNQGVRFLIDDVRAKEPWQTRTNR